MKQAAAQQLFHLLAQQPQQHAAAKDGGRHQQPRLPKEHREDVPAVGAAALVHAHQLGPSAHGGHGTQHVVQDGRHEEDGEAQHAEDDQPPRAVGQGAIDFVERLDAVLRHHVVTQVWVGVLLHGFLDAAVHDLHVGGLLQAEQHAVEVVHVPCAPPVGPVQGSHGEQQVVGHDAAARHVGIDAADGDVEQLLYGKHLADGAFVAIELAGHAFGDEGVALHP